MRRSWVVSAAYRQMIGQLVVVREEAGVGQRELCRRLGKHPSWLNKIENLERRLDVVELVAIARALALQPAELMGRLAADLPAELAI